MDQPLAAVSVRWIVHAVYQYFWGGCKPTYDMGCDPTYVTIMNGHKSYPEKFTGPNFFMICWYRVPGSEVFGKISPPQKKKERHFLFQPKSFTERKSP